MLISVVSVIMFYLGVITSYYVMLLVILTVVSHACFCYPNADVNLIDLNSVSRTLV